MAARQSGEGQRDLSSVGGGGSYLRQGHGADPAAVQGDGTPRVWYLLQHGLGHEHVHLAAEAPGGRVLHQHVGTALAVRRVQEVVPGLTIVLLYRGEGTPMSVHGSLCGPCPALPCHIQQRRKLWG